MIEYFGNANREWFETFLELPHGIPSHDTFGKVFALIEPKEFQEKFLDWVHEIAKITHGQLIAIDGKTIRRSHDRSKGKGTIQLVSAWASKNDVVLGQVKVDDISNEIKARPELLKLLDIYGCIISIDAIGAQKEIVSTILEQGGDYLLTVKQNQGTLYNQIVSAFSLDYENEFKDTPHEYARKENKVHGRIETRECWVSSDP